MERTMDIKPVITKFYSQKQNDTIAQTHKQLPSQAKHCKNP